MDIVFQILLGVIVIFMLVTLYMGRHTWRVYHILTVGALFFALLGFLYLSMRTLKTHQAWHTLAQAYERNITQLERENETLVHGNQRAGDNQQRGIEQFQHELKKTLLDRGRMFNAQRVPGKVPGGLTVNIVAPPAPKPPAAEGEAPLEASEQPPVDAAAGTTPTPPAEGAAAPAEPAQPPTAAGLEPATVVYVFDQAERDKQGQYIGEFTVAAVRGNQVDLAPNTIANQRESERITRARGPFVIYDVMPIDKHEAFTEAEENQVAAALTGLPREVVQQYLKDRKPADSKDSPERTEVKLEFLKDYELPPLPQGVEGPTHFKSGEVAWLPRTTHGRVLGAHDMVSQGIAKAVEGEQPRYARSLRDYKLMLDEAYKERATRTTGIEQANRDIASVKSAAASAKKNTAAEEALAKALTHDLDHVKRELSEMQRHLTALRSFGAKLKVAYDDLLVDNSQRAAQLTNMQLKAADAINRRTGGSQPAESGSLYAPEVLNAR